MLSLLLAGLALAPPAAQAQRPQCVAEDYTISVKRVAVTRSLLLDFGEEGPTTEPLEQMVVYLEAKGNTDDATAKLYRFDPVARVITNAGAALEASGGAPDTNRPQTGAYRLEAPPADATGITVEGELLTYALVDEMDVDFNLNDADVEEETEHLKLTFLGYGTPDDPQRARFKLVLTVPPDPAGGPTYWPQVQPEAVLVGADGTECTPNSTSSSSGGGEGNFTWDLEYGFQPQGDFQPARINFRVSCPMDPTVRVPFKIENVPLPRAPGR